jgi:DNA-binding transcriptional LysR family regulator
MVDNADIIRDATMRKCQKITTGASAGAVLISLRAGRNLRGHGRNCSTIGLMELRHLTSFVAVAEELNFGRAAARLHMSQPPLSQQIKALERDLGVSLFQRNTRSVRLTAAGAAMLDPVRDVLTAVAVARRSAIAAGKGEVGHVSFGFAGVSSAAMLPVLTHAIRAYLPGIELTLQGPLYSGETIGKIVEGTLDLGFATVSHHGGLGWRLVRQDRFLVAVTDSHRFAGARELRLSDLEGESFITFPAARGSELRSIFMAACSDAGFVPRIVQEAPDSLSLLSMVGAGVGIALVVNAAEIIKLEHVKLIPLAEPLLSLPVSLVWRKDNDSPPVLAVLELSKRVLPTPGDSLHPTQ